MAHSHEHHHHALRPELTRNQALVLAALNEADSPLSAYDLLNRLKAEGLKAPLQIYRALDKLMADGLAHRLESLNAFVCCAKQGHEDSSGTIAFAICTDCGRVDEFADPQIRSRLEAWAESHDFALKQATLELRGLCARCRGPKAPPAAPTAP
jgi:Fur family zinc uptake transcriptional regulator